MDVSLVLFTVLLGVATTRMIAAADKRSGNLKIA